MLPDQVATYVDARRRLGLDDGRVALGCQWIVAEDPERAFAAVGPHVLRQFNAYASFGMFGPPSEAPRFDDPTQLVDLGIYRLLDGPTAAKELLELLDAGPIVDWFGADLYPGESVDSAAARIEYMAREFVPRVRAGRRAS